LARGFQVCFINWSDVGGHFSSCLLAIETGEKPIKDDKKPDDKVAGADKEEKEKVDSRPASPQIGKNAASPATGSKAQWIKEPEEVQKEKEEEDNKGKKKGGLASCFSCFGGGGDKKDKKKK